MDNTHGHTGYSSGWQTFVDGEDVLKTGGVNKKLLEEVHLPELVIPEIPEIPAVAIDVTGKEYKSTTDHTPDFEILVDTFFANATTHTKNIATVPAIPKVPEVHYGADPHGTPPKPQEGFPTLPPFYALAWIIFKGY